MAACVQNVNIRVVFRQREDDAVCVNMTDRCHVVFSPCYFRCWLGGVYVGWLTTTRRYFRKKVRV